MDYQFIFKSKQAALACDKSNYPNAAQPFESIEHFAATVLLCYCSGMPTQDGRNINVMNPLYWLRFAYRAYSKDPFVIALRDIARPALPAIYPRFVLGLLVYTMGFEHD